jgi:pimeloyl-ACP methyl ester carboxylesterase
VSIEQDTGMVLLSAGALIAMVLEGCSPACPVAAGPSPAPVASRSRTSGHAQAESFVNAPTTFVEAHGTRYAYRAAGPKSEVPLVCLQHFRGSMDNWDPGLVDALARERTVVIFDNKGVSASSGVTPESFTAMADDAADFISALGYAKVDVLGFSIGGAVAQELAINHPGLVRKLILAATAPPGGGGMNARDPKIIALATKPTSEYEDFLTLFFEPTETSQRLGRAYIERRKLRKEDLDPPSSSQTMRAHSKARNDWGATVDPEHARLKKITQPVLVANGSHDVMMFTPNSVTLFENIPNAQLILYPDSGHGFLFQYPELFAENVSTFLRS